MKTVRAIVSGRVQGVWYRAHTREKAVELGLSGSVRNLPDGTVEIVAQGDQGSVDALVQWAWTGSPSSHVTGVEVQDYDEAGDLTSFEVRH